MAKEPVCNINIDEKTAKYTSEIYGNKAYLCSANCRQQLKQNPSKYVPRHRYIDRKSMLKHLYPIYLHIFFLSTLFFHGIFPYNQICKICNRRIVQYLQILISEVFHKWVLHNNHI